MSWRGTARNVISRIGLQEWQQRGLRRMAAATVATSSGPALCAGSPTVKSPTRPSFHGTARLGNSAASLRSKKNKTRLSSSRVPSVHVRAAKLPAGVEAPKEEPNLPVSLWGFTEKAEVWNSRAAMIGLFALIALEFIAHKGILQLIGVDVGKGLDLPL